MPELVIKTFNFGPSICLPMPKTRPEPVCRWSKCSIQSHPRPVAIVLYYLYLSTLSMLSRVSAAHRVQCNWVHLAVFHVISSGSSLHFILIHCNTAILQALASLQTLTYFHLFVTAFYLDCWTNLHLHSQYIHNSVLKKILSNMFCVNFDMAEVKPCWLWHLSLWHAEKYAEEEIFL